MADRVKVHRVVLMVVDHDELGADSVAYTLEQQKYPNYCVMHIETREVDWDDDHPLNMAGNEKAFAELFDCLE